MQSPLARSILRQFIALAISLAGVNSASAQYQATPLVSNLAGVAHHQDVKLVNAWGIARGPGGPWWVSDQGTAFSTLYNGSGEPQPLQVAIPTVGTGFTGPSGIAFNGGREFKVSKNGLTEPSIFIFATVDGTISGWNFAVDLTQAIVAADNSASGAVYTGLAITTDGTNLLFAADNANNRIDVFDGSFKLVNTLTDPGIPKGFAAYGIEQVNNQIFVTYASTTDVPTGFIDIFSETGGFVKRFAEGPPLNQPWGMTVAPDNFGPFSRALLVSNNLPGGTINAFSLASGKFLGTLKNASGKAIEIDQIWGLEFGGGTPANGALNQLFYTAGPSNYSNGAFGVISFVGR
jgi:uncharacterized protein (TIGR03118 family)